MIMQIKFGLPFLINQCGSLIYFYSLGEIPAHIMSVSTNSLTLVVTMITESLLFGEKMNARKLLGITLTIVGIGLVILENEGSK